MALVVTKRLCSVSLRSRFLPRITTQPYYCYTLTKLNFKQTGSTLRLYQYHKSNINNSASYGALRYFSNNSRYPTKDADEKYKECDKPEDKDYKKLSLFQRFKQMYRDYWYVLVPVHIVTSAAWFGGFYYLASSGVDVPGMLECMNFNERIVNSMRNSSMGYVAITYALYKIATPARYAITLGGTTISIQYLKKWGYIKPMPSKERLKEIFEETKEGMKEKRENLLESVHNLKETVKETKDGIKDKKDTLVSSVKGSKENIKKKVMGSTGSKNDKSLGKS